MIFMGTITRELVGLAWFRWDGFVYLHSDIVMFIYG